MATRSKKIAPVIEEIDDTEVEELLEEDDDTEDVELAEDDDEEVDEPAAKPAKGDGPVERDTYTAKQIATRIGVDPKVLRKFFRSAASTVEPAGQGGRYEFDAADLPKIKAEYEKYSSTKTPRGRKTEGTTTKTKGRAAPASAQVIEEDDELLDLDDMEEPDDSELLDLDVEEIDEGIEEEDDDAEELDEDDDLEELDD